MYVLTIKFNPTATKTYDYLLVNPKGVAIDNGRPLRKMVGATRSGASWQELTIVDKTKMDVLPDWVTARIVLDENNQCTTEAISAEHLTVLRRKKPTYAPVTAPLSAVPAEGPMETRKPKVKPKRKPKTESPRATPYQERPMPPAVQAIIDRQNKIREETITMCQRIFYNNK